MPQDSQYALDTESEQIQNTIRKRLVQHTYTLIDGPDAGSTITYWAEEVSVSPFTTVTVTIPGLPSMTFSQVAVGTSEIAVPSSNLPSRKTVSIKALAANGSTVYVGKTGVTSMTGYELSAGDSIEIDADATVNLVAVSASGTQRVSVAEIA